MFFIIVEKSLRVKSMTILFFAQNYKKKHDWLHAIIVLFVFFLHKLSIKRGKMWGNFINFAQFFLYHAIAT